MLISKRLQRNLELQEIEFNAYAIGEEKGLEQGISQGIEQNKREMVIVMNNNNESIEKISKYTGLTIPEIEQIISKR